MSDNEKEERKRWSLVSMSKEEDLNADNVTRNSGQPISEEYRWSEVRSGSVYIAPRGPHDHIEEGQHSLLPFGMDEVQVIHDLHCRHDICAQRRTKGECPRPCPHFVITYCVQVACQYVGDDVFDRLLAEGSDLGTGWPYEEDFFTDDPEA